MNETEILRPRFQDDQVLIPDDLRLLVDYPIGLQRRHQITHHSWGIVSGLRLEVDAQGVLVVTPGVAVDGYGRFLRLSQVESLSNDRFDILQTDTLEFWLEYAREVLEPAGSETSSAVANGASGDARTSLVNKARLTLLNVGRDLERSDRLPDLGSALGALNLLLHEVDRSAREAREEGLAPVPGARREAERPRIHSRLAGEGGNVKHPLDAKYPGFNGTTPPPDDPRELCPIYLGKVQRIPGKPYSVDPTGRVYAGLRGESIEAPSGKGRIAFAEGGDDETGHATPRFSIRTGDRNAAPWLSVTSEPTKSDDGKITQHEFARIRGETRVESGDMIINQGAVELVAGTAQNLGPLGNDRARIFNRSLSDDRVDPASSAILGLITQERDLIIDSLVAKSEKPEDIELNKFLDAQIGSITVRQRIKNEIGKVVPSPETLRSVVLSVARPVPRSDKKDDSAKGIKEAIIKSFGDLAETLKKLASETLPNDAAVEGFAALVEPQRKTLTTVLDERAKQFVQEDSKPIETIAVKLAAVLEASALKDPDPILAVNQQLCIQFPFVAPSSRTNSANATPFVGSVAIGAVGDDGNFKPVLTVLPEQVIVHGDLVILGHMFAEGNVDQGSVSPDLGALTASLAASNANRPIEGLLQAQFDQIRGQLNSANGPSIIFPVILDRATGNPAKFVDFLFKPGGDEYLRSFTDAVVASRNASNLMSKIVGRLSGNEVEALADPLLTLTPDVFGKFAAKLSAGLTEPLAKKLAESLADNETFARAFGAASIDTLAKDDSFVKALLPRVVADSIPEGMKVIGKAAKNADVPHFEQLIVGLSDTHPLDNLTKALADNAAFAGSLLKLDDHRLKLLVRLREGVSGEERLPKLLDDLFTNSDPLKDAVRRSLLPISSDSTDPINKDNKARLTALLLLLLQASEPKLREVVDLLLETDDVALKDIFSHTIASEDAKRFNTLTNGLEGESLVKAAMHFGEVHKKDTSIRALAAFLVKLQVGDALTPLLRTMTTDDGDFNKKVEDDHAAIKHQFPLMQSLARALLELNGSSAESAPWMADLLSALIDTKASPGDPSSAFSIFIKMMSRRRNPLPLDAGTDNKVVADETAWPPGWLHLFRVFLANPTVGDSDLGQFLTELTRRKPNEAGEPNQGPLIHLEVVDTIKSRL